MNKIKSILLGLVLLLGCGQTESINDIQQSLTTTYKIGNNNILSDVESLPIKIMNFSLQMPYDPNFERPTTPYSQFTGIWTIDNSGSIANGTLNSLTIQFGRYNNNQYYATGYAYLSSGGGAEIYVSGLGPVWGSQRDIFTISWNANSTNGNLQFYVTDQYNNFKSSAVSTVNFISGTLPKGARSPEITFGSQDIAHCSQDFPNYDWMSSITGDTGNLYIHALVGTAYQGTTRVPLSSPLVEGICSLHAANYPTSDSWVEWTVID